MTTSRSVTSLAAVLLVVQLTGLWGIACAAERGEADAAPATDPSPARDAHQEADAAGPDAQPADLLPNGLLVEEGLLVGGQPSAEQLAALKKAGYVTVINLRGEGESGARDAEVTAAGLEYVALPIAGAAGLTEENARALAAILEEVERPAVLHCGSGNRVGGLLALKAHYVDGVGADEAVDYGLESGLTGLEEAVRTRLAQSGPNE